MAERQTESKFNSIIKPVNWDDRFVTFCVVKVSDDFSYKDIYRLSSFNERLFDCFDFFLPVSGNLFCMVQCTFPYLSGMADFHWTSSFPGFFLYTFVMNWNGGFLRGYNYPVLLQGCT